MIDFAPSVDLHEWPKYNPPDDSSIDKQLRQVAPTRELTPEERLWLTVLCDAIYCAQGTDAAAARDTAWLQSDDHYVGSYTYICDILDIDADWLREHIIEPGPDTWCRSYRWIVWK